VFVRRGMLPGDDAQAMGQWEPQVPLGALVEALLAEALAPRPMLAVTAPVYPHGLVADDQPIAPNDIATAFNDLMAETGRLPTASDMGDCLFTAMDIENTALVAPAHYATMGFSVPARLGLEAATGQRPLLLVGDGAFQMTGWELGNCRRYGWDPIVIVFNNSTWGMLSAFQPKPRFNDLGDWRFAEMAAGLGGDGVRVRTGRELQSALRHAVGVRGRGCLAIARFQGR
jgi:indolepyruvate decarboxylase